MSDFPARAQIVIIGGGIVGCSVAYHLARRGCADVVLLERRQLTCGTTWHAAGLVGQLRATRNLTALARYTADLYAGLEAETGRATGFRRTGSLLLATNAARLEEITRGADMARGFGLEAHMLGPTDVRRFWPLASIDDICGAVHFPADAQTNPVDTTQALAKGARNAGAKLFEGVQATAILVDRGRARGVATSRGPIAAEFVVNCAGMWAREIGAWVDAGVPLHAAEHFYVVTEPVQGLAAGLPTLRDPDACTYFKEDAGKLLLGWFEPKAKPWGMRGIPDSFAFDQLPDDLEHIAPLLERAARRLPVLDRVGIKLFFNGPESFTPDDRYLLGEMPEVRNLFVAAGFNSIGIQSAGGAGKVLADWIIDGQPPMDVWDVDIRRTVPFQRNRRYLHDRTTESLGLLYAMHWPWRQPETARGVRRSPLHDRLAAAGACFGEVAGYERPNWFAAPGQQPVYDYAYGPQNWFANSRAEHRAVREAVGLFDQSSFAKFVVAGPDAERVLNRICANDIAVPPGRIVYTPWLNDRGGIEADLTVTREAEDRFLVTTACACQTRDLGWLKRQIPADARAVAIDVSSGLAVLGLMGPSARALLASLTDDDVSDAALPFGASRMIDLGYARVRASRITYVGELGWELVMPSEFAASVFDVLVDGGGRFGLTLCGYHAMNSLRIEKAYRHWGHDITDEDTPLEAGLGFTLAWSKPGGFIGREALLRQREQGVRRRLVGFTLPPDAKLLYHNEPIWRNGVRAGRITSGMYGHTLGAPLGLGYVDSGQAPADAAFIAAGRYEVEVAGTRYPAAATLKPFYDPKGERTRS
jgi:4-methylaminobutanoate oxidase (formaldehyde-forming)